MECTRGGSSFCLQKPQLPNTMRGFLSTLKTLFSPANGDQSILPLVVEATQTLSEISVGCSLHHEFVPSRRSKKTNQYNAHAHVAAMCNIRMVDAVGKKMTG